MQYREEGTLPLCLGQLLRHSVLATIGTVGAALSSETMSPCYVTQEGEV